jgi:hypothetical protein
VPYRGWYPVDPLGISRSTRLGVADFLEDFCLTDEFQPVSSAITWKGSTAMSTSSPSVPPPKASSTSGLGCIVTALVAGIVSAGVSLAVSLVVVLLVIPLIRGSGGMLKEEFAIEEGLADVPLRGDTRKGETQVFYRKPFQSPPKLSFPQGLWTCHVTEQSAESFTLARDVSHLTSWQNIEQIAWKAEGVPR